MIKTFVLERDDVVIKNNWWVALCLAALMLLLPVSSVFAAASVPSFRTWPAQTTTEVKKVWTISFKSPFLSTSINSNTIYVKDSNQVSISTTIKPSADGLTATVTPAKDYAAGDYNLYITDGVKSQDGKSLGEPIILPFTVVVTPPVTPIVEVQSTFNSYVTDFTVKTAPNVYRITVTGGATMSYLGENTYKAGVYGVTKGDTITFYAYDQNGLRLQTYRYLLD